MLAYAVLAGGGVKGAALAGCLSAAKDRGIKFVAYGGTSAGSMVALLSSVGCTPNELKSLLADIDLLELLDDKGEHLKRCTESLDRIAGYFHSETHTVVGRAFNYIRAGCALNKLAQTLWSSLGLYSGNALRDFLLQQVIEKLAERDAEKADALQAKQDVTFGDLKELGCDPLKVVASDVTRHRPVVFPRDCGDYGESVIAAVRASASYPFLFRPVQGAHLLSDGGLASNLPCFLFNEEYRETRIPTIAFDLVSPAKKMEGGYDLFAYSKDILATSLGASDILLSEVADGVTVFPIVLPSGVATLDVDLPLAKRAELFQAGYATASRLLSKYMPLRLSEQAGEDMQQTLRAMFGDPVVFEHILAALARDMEDYTNAVDVRAQIMLNTGRRTRIVVYHYNMEEDTDSDLELPEDAGCTGLAWSKRQPALADLEEAAANPGKWGLSAVQQNKVRTDRKAMLAAPIPGRSGQMGHDSPPIGTVSIDSSTPLADTSWIESNQNQIAAAVVSIITGWAQVIARVLP